MPLWLYVLRDAPALIRSGSYTRRRWDDDLKNSDGSPTAATTTPTPTANRSSSYQRRLAALGFGSGTQTFFGCVFLRFSSDVR